MLTTPGMTQSSESTVRAPRFMVSQQLTVKSKTLGTNISFELQTENVSRSGMLLSWQHNVRVPFLENTILELEIDPHSDMLSAPVACLGKVVRRDTDDDNEDQIRFGVRIVQIDHQNLDAWEKCIDSLSQSGQVVSDSDLRAMTKNQEAKKRRQSKQRVAKKTPGLLRKAS